MVESRHRWSLNVRSQAWIALLGLAGSCGLFVAAWPALAAANQAADKGKAEAALTRGDFAYGRSLQPGSADALQTALLDVAIYRVSVGPSLADLRVFNSEGRAVPHAIRSTLPREKQAELRRKLPLFSLPDARRRRVARSASEGAGTSLSLDAKVTGDGATLRLRTGPASAEQSAVAQPKAWLLDARQLDREIASLDLQLAEGGDFFTHVRIEASDDLVDFQELVARAPVARMEQAGHRIERLQIELPASRRVKADYLRITPVGRRLPVALLGVEASLIRAQVPPARSRVRLVGRAVEDQPGTFDYDIGGGIPIDRVKVIVQPTNSLMEVQLDSASSLEGPWTRRSSGLVYRLEQWESLESPAFHWKVRRSDRFLRLSISAKGGGHSWGAPELEVSWQPEQLVFIATGAAPFTLAYGRSETSSDAFSAAELLRISGKRAEQLLGSTTQLGPVFTLAGAAALERAAPGPRYREFALWAVLILCVTVIVVLSVRLLRKPLLAEG